MIKANDLPLPNSLSTDFRSEVIIASLIEQGMDPESIQIVREGTDRRNFSKDIEEISRHYSVEDLQDYFCVKVNREGMYDMLPEGIFHQSVHRRGEPDKEDLIDEIKVHREEEFFARKFFHLFEQAADKMLVDAYFHETKYDRKTTHREFVTLFEPYWPVLKELNQKQAVFFMHIIPVLHKIRTDFRAVEEAFSLILSVPVRITQVSLPAKKAERYFESQLNGHRTGTDFVLGNTFDDGELDLKLTVGPVSALRMRDFLETAQGYRILEELCDLFLPVNLFVVKEFKTAPEDSVFRLSDETETTFLGINSFI